MRALISKLLWWISSLKCPYRDLVLKIGTLLWHFRREKTLYGILVEKNSKVWCFLIKILQISHFVAKISTYALQEWNFGAFWPNLRLENIVKISRYIASNEISLKYRVYRKKQYRSWVHPSPEGSHRPKICHLTRAGYC